MVSIRLKLINRYDWSVKALLIGGFGVLIALAIRLEINYLATRRYFASINEGITALHQKRLSDAENDWLKALVQDPLRPEAYQLLSHLYIQTGQAERAIPLLTHLYTIAPHTPHVLCYLAEAYALTGQEKDWFETAKRAVQEEPDCPRAHALLGIAYGNQEDHAEAISELSRASALAPDDPKIATSLAQAQLDDADLDGAAKTIHSVITQHPSYAMAYYVLGWDYARRTPTPDNLQIAIQAFEKLRQLDPTHLDALEELGRLYLLAGQNQKAIHTLTEAWNQGDRTSECAYNLATAYRNLGMQDKATAMLQQYQRISNLMTRYNFLLKQATTRPKDVKIATALANIELELHNPEKASQLINAVLQRAPDNPLALKAAATIYANLGDRQKALFYQKRFYDLSTTGDTQK